MAGDQVETPAKSPRGNRPVIAHDFSLIADLQVLYRGEASDLTFAQILNHINIDDDAKLADLIEADGRLRIRLAKSVNLERYIDGVPNLPTKPDALDAAIDMSLRALARTGRADNHVTQKLVSSHPDLEVPIREAAALNNAVWSTMTVRKQAAQFGLKELPGDFGPLTEEGVSRYELLELLGEGAFGQVYLAVDRQLSEADHPARVSIKVFPGEIHLSWMRQHLIDESTKARRIDHANVVRVLDRGVSDDNEDFIVYEFVDGGDLAKHIRRRKDPLTVRDAVRLAACIARGVHAAHMAGLVHCDLKPTNIIMTADETPKVADFGAAIRADSRQELRQSQESEEEPIGNLAFMSPQQYRVESGALTIPSDIYALGGILYWLLTNQLPNGSTPEAIRQTHDAVNGRTEPPSLRSTCAQADRDLEAIVGRAMAADPDKRHSSAAALADDLDAWLHREPIAWTKPRITRRLSLWVRRKPAIAALTFLVIALAIGGGVVGFGVAVVNARVAVEEQTRDTFRAKGRKFEVAARQAHQQGLGEQVLSGIWIGEWLFGPTVLGVDLDRFELWNLRIEVVRELVEQEKARGRGSTKTALDWESGLGFWLIKDGNFAEAGPILNENYTKWEAILAPDDPYLDHVRAMQACVVTRQLADDAGSSADAPVSADKLHAAEATLDRVHQMLEEDTPGSPLHFLILEHLLLLYGPELLNQPESFDEIDQHLAKLRE